MTKVQTTKSTNKLTMTVTTNTRHCFWLPFLGVLKGLGCLEYSVACLEHLRFLSALIDAQFPSSMRILVYMFVMTIEHRRMFFSKVLPSIVLMK